MIDLRESIIPFPWRSFAPLRMTNYAGVIKEEWMAICGANRHPFLFFPFPQKRMSFRARARNLLPAGLP